MDMHAVLIAVRCSNLGINVDCLEKEGVDTGPPDRVPQPNQLPGEQFSHPPGQRCCKGCPLWQGSLIQQAQGLYHRNMAMWSAKVGAGTGEAAPAGSCDESMRKI